MKISKEKATINLKEVIDNADYYILRLDTMNKQEAKELLKKILYSMHVIGREESEKE